MRLVAEGIRKQEITRKLNLREHTVRNYIIRIFEKLEISSRAGFILYALGRQEWDQAPERSRAEAKHNS